MANDLNKGNPSNRSSYVDSQKFFADLIQQKSEEVITAGFDMVMEKVKERPKTEIPEWDRMP